MIVERFPVKPSTIEEAEHYFKNKAIQLKPYGVVFHDFKTLEDGVTINVCFKSGDTIKDYQIAYGFNDLPEGYKFVTTNIGNIDNCFKLDLYCTKDTITAYDSKSYKFISEYYGDKRAERSGVYLMNHIDEGLYILENIGASTETKDAYCLHPIVQSDEALFANIHDRRFFGIAPKTIMLAMEYRYIANAYLSKREIHALSEINLGVIPEVKQMLIADKIQNRKDFELYHINTHERSGELSIYFHNWMEKLGINETEYQDYKSKLMNV